MLFALLATFLGVFLDSYFPNYRPMEYVPESVMARSPSFLDVSVEEQEKFVEAMNQLGAKSVRPTEAQQL